MTTTNKYVLSGVDFNLNFFLLAVQVRQHVEIMDETRCANTALVCRLCCCHLDVQDRWFDLVPRLQQRRG